MKFPRLRAGWAAALSLVLTGSSLAAPPPASALYATGNNSGAPIELLPVGTSRAQFLERKGLPDAWLSTETCVYWHQSSNRPEESRGYDTLIVVFTRDRVSEMRLVPAEPVRRFLAVLERRYPAARLAPDYATHGLRTR